MLCGDKTRIITTQAGAKHFSAGNAIGCIIHITKKEQVQK